jgi:predicted metal-binding transcription factor (methanogenesis marker protein 9)
MEERILTSDELERFNASRTKYVELRSRLADITITEERLKTDKQSTLMNIDMAQNEYAIIQKEIYDKYGEGMINGQTGEIS